MLSSSRTDACQAPDRLTEAGHMVMGMGADLWSIEDLRVQCSQMEKWQVGKSAHRSWVRKCFVSTVAHRGVMIRDREGQFLDRA